MIVETGQPAVVEAMSPGTPTIRSRRSFKCGRACGLFVLAVLSTAATHASPDTERTVGQRQLVMRHTADAAKRIAEMFDGRQRYSRSDAVSAAETIRSASGAALISLFTGRIEGGKTQALPAINDNHARFAEHADEMARLSSALSNALGRGPDEITDAMRMGGGGTGSSLLGALKANRGDDPAEQPAEHIFHRLLQTCTSCHATFRKRSSPEN